MTAPLLQRPACIRLVTAEQDLLCLYFYSRRLQRGIMPTILVRMLFLGEQLGVFWNFAGVDRPDAKACSGVDER